MTERFPKQRNRSAQRRADAPQVSANAPGDDFTLAGPVSSAEDTASDLEGNASNLEGTASDLNNAASDLNGAVFDESFVAAASVHEPTAYARAVRLEQPSAARRDPARGPGPGAYDEPPPARWSVRPSHHLAAVRLPAVATLACLTSVAVLLFVLLR